MASTTYAPGKISGAVINLGSENCVIAEVNSSGSRIGIYGQIGIVKDSQLTDNTDQTVLTSEGGTQYKRDGTRNVEFTLTIMQSDPISVQSVNLMRGKYFAIVKEHSQTTVSNGTDDKYPFLLMPLAKFVPEQTIKQPGGETQLKFALEKVQASTTMDLTAAALNNTFSTTISGNSVFAANEYWKVAEFS